MMKNSETNMLDENDLMEMVCSFLRKKRYEIVSRCCTIECGIDICAEKSSTGERIEIETKGATSSRPGSARFGKPYTQQQVFHQVATGLYAVFQMKGKSKGNVRHALALPDTELFHRFLAPVEYALCNSW